MMTTPPWYVLVGAPSSGKTTVLNRLKELGYFVVPETARSLIEEEIRKGKTAQEIRENELLFEKQLLQMRIKAEENAPKNRIVFFDRAIPEGIAYRILSGLDTTAIEQIARHRYKKIFFFERLKLIKDRVRTENEEDTKKLNNLIFQAYKAMGYEIIRVPELPVEERVKIILANIGIIKRNKMTLAGCAIINKGSILLLHRKRKGWYEMPGGKIESIESPEETAVRELKEELQCDIEIIRKIGAKDFEENTHAMTYHWFLARIKEGQKPSIGESDTFDHFSFIQLDNLSSHELSPNMKNFVKELENKNIALEEQVK